jgi:hypothetical protein
MLDEIEVDFFNTIKQEVDKGYGIIPLVGSGLSFQSGIMLGADIGNYLNTLFCHIFIDGRHLDLHKEGWPSPFDDIEVKKARVKIKDLYVATCGKYGVEIVGNTEIRINNFSRGTAFHPIEFSQFINTYLARPYLPELLNDISGDIREHDNATRVILSSIPNFHQNQKHDSYPVFHQDHIVELGLRSLHSWTKTLDFFARLVFDNQKNRYSFHDEADPVVIDSFNSNMVGNRKPNQNHYLLTHLVSGLNVKNILTTNFDTLIEDSLRSGGIRVKVVQLEKNSSLPSQTVTSESLTLIKLHGENQSTRADDSIHDFPSLNDRNNFCTYFYPTYSYKKLPASHLFCLGTSLSDQRINHLIKYVLSMKKHFKVFISIGRNQSKEIILNTLGHEYKNRIIFTPKHNSEYVLYELFQRLTLRLPPGGFNYQYDQYIPPIPEKVVNSTKGGIPERENLKAIRSNISKWMIEYLSDDNSNNTSESTLEDYQNYGVFASGNLVSLVNRHGVSNYSGEVFRKLVEKRMRCLWFELEDFLSPFELLSQIFYSAMLQLGRIHHEISQVEYSDFHGAKLSDESEQRLKDQIEGHVSSLKMTPNDWVLFVYGRNTPGECSGLTDNIKWDNIEDEFSNLHCILKILTDCKFKIVYMPSTQERADQCLKNYKEFGHSMDDIGNQNDIQYFYNLHKNIKPKPQIIKSLYAQDAAYYTSINVREYLQYLLSENDEDSWIKLRFLYACSLFRQSRHFNSLISEAVYPCEKRFNYEGYDNDYERSEKVREWQIHYAQLGIFLIKPGGYIWKYRDVRVGIKAYLEKQKTNKNKINTFLSIKSRTHYWIGDWYHKALFSTLHPTPLKESVYHMVSAIRYAKHARQKYDKTTPKSSDYKYRFSIILRSIYRITKILLHSKDRIPGWINDASYEQCLSAQSIINSFLGAFEIVSLQNDNAIADTIRTLVGDHSEEGMSDWISDEYTVVFKAALMDMIKESHLLALHRNKAEGKNFISKVINLRNPVINPLDAIVYSNKLNSVELDPWRYQNHEGNDFYRYISEIMDETTVIHDSIAYQALKKYILNDLSNSVNQAEKIEKDAWSKELDKAYSAVRFTIVEKAFNRPHEIAMCITSCSDVAHLLIRRSKMLLRQRLSLKYVNKTVKKAQANISHAELEERTWVAVTTVCALGIDLCRFLPVSYIDVEMELSAKMHSLYGLALGNLNRFNEAFRRINESLTLNFYFHDARKRHNSIACYLRRVEIILLQQVSEFEKCPAVLAEDMHSMSSDQQRRLVQLLDKAYFNLGMAQDCFPTENYEPFWRGRLIMLQLRLYVTYLREKEYLQEISPRLLINDLNIERKLYDLLKSGIDSSQSDVYRKLCFFDLYTQSLEYHLRHMNPEVKRFTIESISKMDYFNNYTHETICECIPDILSLSKSPATDTNDNETKRHSLKYADNSMYDLPYNYAARDLLSALIFRLSKIFGATDTPKILHG